MKSKYVQYSIELFSIFLLLSFSGCQNTTVKKPVPKEWLINYNVEESTEEVANKRASDYSSEEEVATTDNCPSVPEEDSSSMMKEEITFYDVFRNEYTMKPLTQVSPNPYKPENYIYIDRDLTGRQMVSPGHEKNIEYSVLPSGETMGYEGILQYEDEIYSSHFGIDVSKFQKNINWEKVKEAGVEFAIIRAGYRGYGKEGSLHEDPYFKKNIQGAKAAGIDVGVYIYAQAINEEEAIEEACHILKIIEGYEIDLPIVYDPESVLNASARTDDVSPEQFTKNAVAFCKEITAAGYQPMIYTNMLWQAYKLDLSQLSDIPIWYADYERLPQTPYNFEIWQYSQCGRISGISGYVDLNIMIYKK